MDPSIADAETRMDKRKRGKDMKIPMLNMLMSRSLLHTPGAESLWVWEMVESSDSQMFWFWNPFMLLKIVDDSKEFLCEL